MFCGTRSDSVLTNRVFSLPFTLAKRGGEAGGRGNKKKGSTYIVIMAKEGVIINEWNGIIEG